MMTPLLRAQQVAQILNLRPSTVYAMAERGDLPHVRIKQGAHRNLIRFRREDLEDFLDSRTVPPSRRGR